MWCLAHCEHKSLHIMIIHNNSSGYPFRLPTFERFFQIAKYFSSTCSHFKHKQAHVIFPGAVQPEVDRSLVSPGPGGLESGQRMGCIWMCREQREGIPGDRERCEEGHSGGEVTVYAGDSGRLV